MVSPTLQDPHLSSDSLTQDGAIFDPPTVKISKWNFATLAGAFLRPMPPKAATKAAPKAAPEGTKDDGAGAKGADPAGGAGDVEDKDDGSEKGERSESSEDDNYADSYSVNSDWVPWMKEQNDHSIDEYREQIQDIPGSSEWFPEQKKIHQLLWMRGHHPVFPRSWEYHFLMWGLPQRLYREVGSEKRVAISSRGNEFRAMKAIEPLMDLTIRIADCELIDNAGKIKELIVYALRDYIAWAEEDAGVLDKDVLPVVEVYHYSDDFGFDDDKVKYTHEELLQNIQDDIEDKMQKLAKKHRDALEDDTKPGGWLYMPPLLFGYAVIHNFVLIVCLDSSDENASVPVLEHLSLASPSQWLWNALTLAFPINKARDYLFENRDLMEDKDAQLMDLDDPDL